MIKSLIRNILKRNVKSALERYNPTIIAVCGSVGKTTVRNLLAQSLREYGAVGSNRKNYNSEWGIIFSILQVEAPGKNPLEWLKIMAKSFAFGNLEEEFPDIWVLELGVDKPGDMDFFVQDFLKFDAVIFTFYGESPVHLENFESVKDLVQEDLNALTALKDDGFVIANSDDPMQASMIKKHKDHIITYGLYEADVTLVDIQSEIDMVDDKSVWDTYGTAIKPILHQKISYRGGLVPFQVEYMFGTAQAKCLLPVVSFFIHEGVNLIEISQKITTFQPVNGRMRFFEGIKDTLIIDDTYNAAPASVEEGLRSMEFIKLEGARKIAVLGSMMELGEKEIDEHARIGQVAAEHVDILVTVGDKMIHAHKEFQFHKSYKAAIHVQEPEDAVDWIRMNVTPNDIFYVKGSASTHMERVVAELISFKKYRTQNLVRQYD